MSARRQRALGGRRARTAIVLGAMLGGVLPAARAAAQLPAVLRPATSGRGRLDAAAAAPRRARRGPAARAAPSDVVRDVLARPHLLVVAPDTGLTFGRGTHAERTLVVVGGPVRLASTVRGDVLVFGDLFLRPGANIQGRAVAVGGGVYNSTLAQVGGERLSYRGVEASGADGSAGLYAVDLRTIEERAASRLTIPGFYGFRIPLYDRVNGLSVSFGPELALDTGRVRLEPLVTYRSQLGTVDAGVRASAGLTRGVVAELRAERGTFTNDAWSRSDLINSVIFAGTGGDARNYYRADRFEATLTRPAVGARGILEPLLGVRVERAWSAERTTESSRPFTLFGRDDRREGSRRPNPAVTGGRVTSALVGVLFRRDTDAGTRGRAEARVEQSLDVQRGGQFTRALIDLAFEHPLRGEQRLVLLGHAAVTAGGDDVPTQRYAYLGGGPTIPTLYLLEQGGTELVWAEGRYTIPLRIVRVPVVGSYPAFTLRAMAGAAGVNGLPALTPNIGLRLSVGPLRGDYIFDPRGRGRRVLTAGVGLR